MTAEAARFFPESYLEYLIRLLTKHHYSIREDLPRTRSTCIEGDQEKNTFISSKRGDSFRFIRDLSKGHLIRINNDVHTQVFISIANCDKRKQLITKLQQATKKEKAAAVKELRLMSVK